MPDTATVQVHDSYEYFIKDHLGSTRSVIDANSSVVESRDYYPFGLYMPGRSVVAAGNAAKEHFTGKERDAETDWDYFGARYYDPVVGRWASVAFI